MPLDSYEDVLPSGLAKRIKNTLNPAHIPLVQQLVNMVGKRDTGELYKERALAKLKKYKPQLSGTEHELLLDVVNWIAQNIDYVKRRRFRGLCSKYLEKH